MKNHFLKRLMPGVLSAAMVLGNCPVLSLAASDGKDQEISVHETERSRVASPSDPEKPSEGEREERYVLMNIPYEDFYENEVSNDIGVDGVSSATLNKTRTGTLVGGSYHEKSDGSRINGITFPVKVGAGVDLSGYRQVTEEDWVEITVTNRGQESTVVYKGKDALFENRSYAYYELEEEPEYYKELTMEDGDLSFGQLVSPGQAQRLEGSDVELMTDSGYGDYQISLGEVSGLEMDVVYGVILKTQEGSGYGLRHLENIWRGTELAWSAGFTKEVHGSPVSSAHYENIMGQTLDQIVFYTDQGVYEMDVDLYVPVKFDGEVSVEDASKDGGSTKITVKGLPEDFEAEYDVKNQIGQSIDVSVVGEEMIFSDAPKGRYTLTVRDKGGKYASLVTDFILYTEDMPARYRYNGGIPALVKTSEATDEEFEDYIKNITSVSVNGKSYNASGRGAVVIIREDGTIDTAAEPFAQASESGSYEIEVTSTGYLELAFVYRPGGSGGTSFGGSTGSGSGSSGGRQTSAAEAGHWESRTSEDGRVLWVYLSDRNNGVMYAGSWAYLYNPFAADRQPSYGWFHFGTDGFMDTGWFTDTDGNRYYLDTAQNGIRGMALTGWQMIDEKWYYFRDWDGAPYGSLLTDGQTPDGYEVDSNGEWITNE